MQDLRSKKDKEIKEILDEKERQREQYEVQIDEITISLKSKNINFMLKKKDNLKGFEKIRLLYCYWRFINLSFL